MGKGIKKYRIVFTGLLVDIDSFKKNMAKFGVPAYVLDKYVNHAPAVVKRDLRLQDARKYAEVILNAGGLVNIQEAGEFSDVFVPNKKERVSTHDFVVCNNCGFKQSKRKYCARCGANLKDLF